MNGLEFVHPYLFLLALVSAASLYIFWVRRRPSVSFPSIARIKAINRHSRAMDIKKLVPFILIVLAAAALTLALTRPRRGLEEIRTRAEGIDIIIALDLSGSMEAYDVPRGMTTMSQVENAIAAGTLENRLATAKREIAEFITERPNDRIGLIAFAPLPYAACPPTLDHSWLLAHLNSLKEGAIGDSTNIAGPVASAVKRLKDSDAKRKIIVLFTDGKNNVSAKVTPRQAAKLAAAFDITIYTVGIGSNSSVALQELPFGSRLVQIHNEFDEKLLSDMAETSGGKYYRAEDSDSMAAAMKEIDALEKTSFEQQKLVNWKELSPRLALASLICLLLAFAAENTFCLKTP